MRLFSASVTMRRCCRAKRAGISPLAARALDGVRRAYALFVGALSLRTRGVYFIMVTLAFAQMAYFIAHDTRWGGGSDGIYLSAKPSVGGLVDLRTAATFSL